MNRLVVLIHMVPARKDRSLDDIARALRLQTATRRGRPHPYLQISLSVLGFLRLGNRGGGVE